MQGKLYVLNIDTTNNNEVEHKQEVFNSFDALWIRYKVLSQEIKNQFMNEQEDYSIHEFNCKGCTTFLYSNQKGYKYELYFNKQGNSTYMV